MLQGQLLNGLLIGLLTLFLVQPNLTYSAFQEDSSEIATSFRAMDPRSQLKVLQKFYFYNYRYNANQSKPYIQQAVRISKLIGDPYTESKSYSILANAEICLGNLDSAFVYNQRGKQLADSLRSDSLQSFALYNFGEIARIRGNSSEAQKLLFESMQKNPSDIRLRGQACFALGLLYRDAGITEKAVTYFQESLKCKERLKRPIDVAFMCANLGDIYYLLPQEDLAFQYLNRAIGIFQKEKYPRGLAYVYTIFGQHCMNTKQYSEAVRYFKLSYRTNLLDSINGKQNITFQLTNIGSAYLKIGKLDSSEIYLQKSYVRALRLHDDLSLSCCLLSLGELRKAQNRPQEAIVLLQKGIGLSYQLNYREPIQDAYQVISEIYTTLNNPDKALFYLIKRNQLKDSLINEKSQKIVADLILKYESEKKDAQILSLTSQHEKEHRIRRNVTLIIIVITTFVLVFSSLALFYYRRFLRPRIETSQYILNRISDEKVGDHRRLKSLQKILPPEMNPPQERMHEQEEIDADLLERLIHQMEQEKIYLDEGLTLQKMAELLNTNTTYLSRTINDHYHLNFSAYLSNYRIEEAKKMMLDQSFDHLSIEGIGKNAGFRSKSTFNQTFKRITGVTPTEFAHQNREQRN